MKPTLPARLVPNAAARRSRGFTGVTRPAGLFALALTAALLAGCTRAPAITLAGATFPGWFFCLAGGVVATVVVHVVLERTLGTAWLRPLPVSYTGLFAIFSALIWLVFFYR